MASITLNLYKTIQQISKRNQWKPSYKTHCGSFQIVPNLYMKHEKKLANRILAPDTSSRSPHQHTAASILVKMKFLSAIKVHDPQRTASSKYDFCLIVRLRIFASQNVSVQCKSLYIQIGTLRNNFLQNSLHKYIYKSHCTNPTFWNLQDEPNIVKTPDKTNLVFRKHASNLSSEKAWP